MERACQPTNSIAFELSNELRGINMQAERIKTQNEDLRVPTKEMRNSAERAF